MSNSREDGYITIDRVLQTVGGILLLLCSTAVFWGAGKLVEHEREITRMNAEASAMKELIMANERRSDEKLKEIVALQKELNNKIDLLRMAR